MIEDDNYPMGRSICGAKNRQGGECRQPPMPNGRCRFHGGMSLAGKDHGRYVHGKYTKDALANRREIKAMRALARMGLLPTSALAGLTRNIERCGSVTDHLWIQNILFMVRWPHAK